MTFKNLLEEFFDGFQFKSSHSSKPIYAEIYKNPKKGELASDSFRGIVTKNGDLYAAKNSEVFHTALIKNLKEKGIIIKARDPYKMNITNYVPVTKKEGTNNFYIAPFWMPSKLSSENRETLNNIFTRARKKNPNYNFFKVSKDLRW